MYTDSKRSTKDPYLAKRTEYFSRRTVYGIPYTLRQGPYVLLPDRIFSVRTIYFTAKISAEMSESQGGADGVASPRTDGEFGSKLTGSNIFL